MESGAKSILESDSRMLQDTATRATLPTPLLDALTEALPGLRHVRLLRARGAKGHELVPGGSWTLHGEDGEPTGPGEEPEDDAERIVEVVMAHAAESFAEAGSADRRHKVELVRVLADGELETKSIGFKLEEHHEARGGSPKERAEAALLGTMTDYIRMLQNHSVRLLGENSNAIRQVSMMIPKLVELRFDALEDRAEALLERGGVEKSDEDPAWVRETGATLRTFLVSAAPTLAKKLGLEEDAAPTDSLRGKLAELGKSITSEQRDRIVSAAGALHASKLLQAGEAATEEDAAALCQQVLDGLGPKLDDVAEVLNEEQTKLLGEVFERIEAVLTEAAKSKGKPAK